MTIYIIGAGNMGTAIAKVLSKTPHKVYLSDKHNKNFSKLAKADFVIVAVKPQDFPVLADEVRGKINPSAIIISIAAGVPITKIQKLFGHSKVVRVMPNLGLLVGQGVAAWKSSNLSVKEQSQAKKLLDRITENFEVADESKIDAVTAISGSGPAYFFYLAQSLYQSAKQFGFADAVARKLVEKTFSASALLQAIPQRVPLWGSPEGNPLGYGELIGRVRSKKGTTDAALKVFDKHHLNKIIKLGVSAARKRAQELSK